MSYTPTEWNTGDTITAAKLNKMEQGIANGGSGALIVTGEYINGTLTMDKTVQEIYDALEAGTPVYYSYFYGTLSDYTAQRHLAPIVCVYNYNYTDVLRVAVSQPMPTGILGTKMYVFVPSIVAFQASGLDQYPTYYTRVAVKADALSV